MIDFKATHELNKVIGFVNDKGETVRTYSLIELEQFVTDKHLNLSYEHEAEGGTGMVCDTNTNFNEIEVITPLSEWLDNQDNFVEACKQFYTSKNPQEFKSFNREQETRKAVRV